MLEKEITETLKKALKNGETTRVSVLRMLISDIKNKKIADRAKELSDDMIRDLVRTSVRRHKESIEQFKKGMRDDLVKKEREELRVLEAYLPSQISKEEIISVVDGAIDETKACSLNDVGTIMRTVMGRVKGRADGSCVKEIVIGRLLGKGKEKK